MMNRPSDSVPATGKRSMPMVTVRMTHEQRELLNDRAVLADMTLQAYCLRKLFNGKDEEDRS